MSVLAKPAGVIAVWLLGSPWMLFWALAAVIPLLIHLWSRRRYDEVPWAAMRFLLAAMRKNARRWRLEQLILLAMRMLLLLLLALAVADPLLTWLGEGAVPAGEAGRTHHVLVLDASYSMDSRVGQTTLFEAARSQAVELVEGAARGDAFTLLLLARPPLVVVRQPVFDREAMLEAIDQTRRTDGGADLAATLAEIEEVLKQAQRWKDRLTSTRIRFFTDLGRNTWDAVSAPAVQAALRRLEDNAELVLVDVGSDNRQNVGITRLGIDAAAVTLGTPVRLSAEVENFGTRTWANHAVELFVDGERIEDWQVELEGGAQKSLAATHRFATPGDHICELRSGTDPLAADNRRWLVVPARAKLKVLCVEGKAGTARNVALALSPSNSNSPIEPVVRSEIALQEENLRRYDCIVLCNVGRFATTEARRLRKFLEQGGGLVFWLGDQVQPENYNRTLGPDAVESQRCFSVRLGEPVELGEYQFDPLGYEHPVARPFRGHERAGLLTTPIWKYLPLRWEPSGAATAALGFTNGDPAIVEQPRPAGRVFLVATDASSVSVDRSTDPPTPWSALAAWPSFPPLMQQLLQSAVRGQADSRNLLVGDTLTGRLDPGTAATSVTVVTPSGSEQRVPLTFDGESLQWNYPAVAEAGVYEVGPVGGEERGQQFAANPDTRESRLTRLDESRIPSQFRQRQAERRPVREVGRQESKIPLFRWLLAGVLALLVCETFCAWFFGRSAV